jgi:hypothetical protein
MACDATSDVCVTVYGWNGSMAVIIAGRRQRKVLAAGVVSQTGCVDVCELHASDKNYLN